MIEITFGYQLVNPEGNRVDLCSTASGASEGTIIRHYWRTYLRADNLRRQFGGSEEGEKDCFPIPVQYESQTSFRYPNGVVFLLPDAKSYRIGLIEVKKDLRRKGAQANWRWNTLGGFWERSYQTGWKSQPRILGEEQHKDL